MISYIANVQANIHFPLLQSSIELSFVHSKTKSLKRPTSIKAEIWSKLNDDQKKEAIEKAAQDELNATNVAAHATFKMSSSVKRQSSSTSINDENKKAATSGADLQPNQV